ncbi:MAG: DOMON-like domain-containing protein [Parvularculaceae bacterium]
MARIVVDAVRPRPDVLQLRYQASGLIGDLKFPKTKTPARTDGLWRHTCFEAFVRAGSDAGYSEFNLSPSGAWAAYRFGGYRDKITPIGDISTPAIEVRRSVDSIEFKAEFELAGAGLPVDQLWLVGLSAVIEETSGRLSYWALKHPAGEPDFHHVDCFAVELAPPLRP